MTVFKFLVVMGEKKALLLFHSYKYINKGILTLYLKKK